MRAAVERLFHARQQQEPLVIFGDYDVDGVTSDRAADRSAARPGLDK